MYGKVFVVDGEVGRQLAQEAVSALAFPLSLENLDYRPRRLYL